MKHRENKEEMNELHVAIIIISASYIQTNSHHQYIKILVVRVCV